MPQPRIPQEELPQLLVTPFELMRAASGNPMTVRTEDGQYLCLRLPTAEEMFRDICRANDELPEDCRPPEPTPRQVEEMVRPLSF